MRIGSKGILSDDGGPVQIYDVESDLRCCMVQLRRSKLADGAKRNEQNVHAHAITIVTLLGIVTSLAAVLEQISCATSFCAQSDFESAGPSFLFESLRAHLDTNLRLTASTTLAFAHRL